MDQLECITKSPHRKGAYLTFEERVIIQTRLCDGWSPPQIAKEICCAPNTVRNGIRRGKVPHTKAAAVRGRCFCAYHAYHINKIFLRQEKKSTWRIKERILK